jgi:hypothetical protein
MKRDYTGSLLADITDEEDPFTFRLTHNYPWEPQPPPWTHNMVLEGIQVVFLLRTDNNTEIEARKLKENSLVISLFERLHNGEDGNLIARYSDFASGLRELKISADEIDPSFNCHGFCFADSEYWIQPDQVEKILQGDNYREALDNDKASVVIFCKEGKPVHSAIRYWSDANHTYANKSGVRKVEKVFRLEDAYRENEPYDTLKFYTSEKMLSRTEMDYLVAA